MAGFSVHGLSDAFRRHHQILVPMIADVAAPVAMAALAHKGILVGTCADPTSPGNYALRAGTQFIIAQGQDSDISAIVQRLAEALKVGANKWANDAWVGRGDRVVLDHCWLQSLTPPYEQHIGETEHYFLVLSFS